ncbi:MAG: hypothetical protein WBS24_03575, partial [Terriglobales bacterium]
FAAIGDMESGFRIAREVHTLLVRRYYAVKLFSHRPFAEWLIFLNSILRVCAAAAHWLFSCSD